LLVLWAPGLFRLTCYYYRGAYYKAFWADPPSCTVSEPRKKYWGENSFPLIIQNIHRYFLYVALFFILFLGYDVWKALWFTNPSGKKNFGIGIGTLVLAGERCSISGLYLRVPLTPPSGRWIYRSSLGFSGSPQSIYLC
jgi:hypothetical protein